MSKKITGNGFFRYQSNCRILKKFFSSPLTLICGILAAISFITEHCVFVLPTDFENKTILFFGAFNTPGIVLLSVCIGLIVLFVRSKNTRVENLTPSIVLFKVAGIIDIVLGALAILAISALFLFLVFWADISAESLSEFCVVYGSVSLLSVVRGVALLGWSRSVKEGQSSVYLSSKGSIFFAVILILSAIAYATAAVFTPQLYELSTSAVSDAAHEAALRFPLYSSEIHGTISSSVVIGSKLASESCVFVIAKASAKLLFLLSFAALAISYHVYIKRLTKGINLGSLRAEPTAQAPCPRCDDDDMILMGYDRLQPEKPNFSPQTVNFDKLSKGTSDTIKSERRVFKCPYCGTSHENKVKFCAECGAKLSE